MSTTKRAEKLPRYVRAFPGKRGTTYASWIPLGRNGRKRWTPRLATPELAAKAREVWLRNRDDLPTATLTLKAAVDRVAHRLETTRRAGTVTWFRCHADVLMQWFGEGTALARINAKKIRQWREEQISAGTVSVSTIHHRRRALSLIFADEKNAREVPTNPLHEVRRGWPSIEQKEAAFFAMDELAAILETIRTSEHATGAEDADVLAAVALTGLRRSEFSRLRICDVDLGEPALFVHGKKKNETMALGSEAVAVLARVLERAKARGDEAGDEALLFVGGPEGLTNLARRWAKSLKQPKLRLHALRHTFVTGLVRSGLGLATVQRLARHAVVQMTAKYFHGSEDEAESLSRLSLAPKPKGPRPLKEEPDAGTKDAAKQAQ